MLSKIHVNWGMICLYVAMELKSEFSTSSHNIDLFYYIHACLIINHLKQQLRNSIRSLVICFWHGFLQWTFARAFCHRLLPWVFDIVPSTSQQASLHSRLTIFPCLNILPFRAEGKAWRQVTKARNAQYLVKKLCQNPMAKSIAKTDLNFSLFITFWKFRNF